MGADLIGYFTFVPANWEEIAQKKIDDLNRIMSKADPSKLKTTIARFVKAGASWPQLDVEDYFTEGETPEEILETIKECIPTMARVNEALSTFLRARDSVYTPMKVKGVKFDVTFCGELSWGDEPDGHGYKSAELLEESGITMAWYAEVTKE